MFGLNLNLDNKKGSLAGLPMLPNKPKAFLDGLLVKATQSSYVVNESSTGKSLLLSMRGLLCVMTQILE